MNNPELDLVLTRNLDISAEQVWRAWTEPELLMEWFCPKPWKTTECEIDLQPGGKFRTLMQGPEGESFDGTGCYLVVEPNKRLVWTSALLPDYRPQVAPEGGFLFTADLTLTPTETGCTYTVMARHADKAGKDTHEAMGFHDGWGKALDQLVELMKNSG